MSARRPSPFYSEWIDHSVEVPASAERVYALLRDVDGWPAWTPGLLSIKRRGGRALEPGTRFLMTIAIPGRGRLTLPCVMYVLQAPTRIEWGGGFLGSKIRHFFELEPLAGGRTRIRHVEYATGLFALVPGAKAVAYRHDKAWSDVIAQRFG